MTAPAIARLGHVGIHCSDLDAQTSFYRDVLGLHVTDEDTGLGMVFMSARPQEEHHELLLCGGRNVTDRNALLLQQLSFRCDSLDDVIGYYRRLKDNAVKFDMVVSHGNAVGVYFRDPEGNRLEVYWPTGLAARQPFVQALDLDQPAEMLLSEIERSVAAYGETGFIDPSVLAGQDLA